MRKRAAIIGGGISGLSAAWYLSRYNYDIWIFEKNSKLGGWIDTSEKKFFFEKGPRSFSSQRSPDLLSLIEDLNLSDDIIYSGNDARNRYLYIDKKLQKIPTSFLSFLLSKLTRKHAVTLFKELFKQRKNLNDETIFSFVKRRFNEEVALKFFDPITTGIYGGDIHLLSIRSCFPYLYELEQKYGSIIKGMVFQKKTKKKNAKGPLFTLKRGMSQLLYKISEEENIHIVLSTSVEKVSQEGEKAILHTKNVRSEFDLAIVATPFHELKSLFPSLPLDSRSIPYNNLTTVNVGINKSNLLMDGFGYLVPRIEGEKLLGVIFDSNIFKEQNKKNQSRLTIITEEELSNNNLTEFVEDVLKRHLNITDIPAHISYLRCKNAIPQYCLGHKEKILKVKNFFKERYSKILFTGNYFENVSVDGCINKSKQIVNKIENKFKL